MLMLVWVYHQVFGCCRRVENILFSPVKKDDAVPVSSLPWLWIGAVYVDGNVVDHTHEVNSTVEYGMLVSPVWMEVVTGAKNVEWKYLDSQTLEEKDFPSDGFVIDDPIQSEVEDSDDE
jgi:hypothetical protein